MTEAVVESDAQRLQAAEDRLRLLQAERRLQELRAQKIPATPLDAATPSRPLPEAPALPQPLTAGTAVQVTPPGVPRVLPADFGEPAPVPIRAAPEVPAPESSAPRDADYLGLMPGFEFMGVLPQGAQQSVAAAVTPERAKGVAATGINVLGSVGGAAAGSAVAGPAGIIPGEMAGSLAARKANVALGLEAPGLVGDVTATAIPAVARLPVLALKSLQSALSLSRGAKQLKHTAAMEAAEQTAQAARVPIEAARQEGAQLATEAGLQSRELRVMREGAFAGAKEQLGKKAEALQELVGRAQAGARTQLGKTSGEDVENLVRIAGKWGPEVSDEAVTLAYRQLDEAQGLFVPRQKLDATVSSLPPSVRSSLAESLSVIPTSRDGTISFGQLRAVQSQVGKNIRMLERQVARGEDVNAPARLEAMKKVYASTFDVLDEAITSGRAVRKQYSQEGPAELLHVVMPADTKQLLQDANTLNRTMSLIDRIGALRETRGTRIVGGDVVFDADGLLRAIKGDGFLTRMLKQEGAYDGLTESLGRIASAQKGKIVGEGFDPSGLTSMQQQLRRQEALRTVGRERAAGELKRTTDIQMGTIDEQLKAAQERIGKELPAQEGRAGRFVAASALLSGTAIGGYFGPAAGVTMTGAIAGFDQISRWLLTKNGQRYLEQLFAKDPRITTSKLSLLAAAARGAVFQPVDEGHP